ncbi:MAG: TonB-dependent receptor [Cyclobacteriaceae bacterium]|nr:TonB-dependent receptor [Cyclobacteriaceae bacterium]UYN86427.1 MAG: TonB-dependent receptor [Cyclobacteriaceae bacterium]
MPRNFTITLFLIFSVLSLNLTAQSLIKGQLFDASSNEPLIGATVSVKGTGSGAATGSDGKFELKYSGEFPVTLRISYVGYDSKEVVVDGKNDLSVSLIVSSSALTEVLVTARRRKEEVQDIPIPITVLGSFQIENTVSFNVNRIKELVPSVQLYSSNPRNTTLNIRGIGSTFGLTNDGIDPGVGFYVDGVYYARPAATTIDFIDIEQIEVLRGPQGTLFGKNTTAGTFNITTRRPSFKTGGDFELSYGNFGFTQAKASVTGPLVNDKLALRVSFTGTHRDGLIYNQATEKYVNTLNNVGVRGQLLYLPTDKIEVLFAVDHTRQRPDGYAQVFAGVAPTQRAAYRQFENIIADLNYDLPTRNPFDRVIDHDTPWKSGQDMGGISINADFDLGKGKLTSTTAWRYWTWDPSNDRDFTGLQGLRLSQAPSQHYQLSQELRYAGEFSSKLSGVFGVFLFSQNLKSDPVHTEEAGRDQWRFSQSTTSNLWATPGLLDGYGIKTTQLFENFSGAVFGQLEWTVSDKFSVLPGIRINYDKKSVDFSRVTYGGLETDDPALIAIKRSVYNDQAFVADVNKTNYSGQLTVSYKANKFIRTFATYAVGFKPVGLNLGGLPSVAGQPLVELATIKPEQVNHVELGIKTQPTANSMLNLTVFNSDIKDYQTLVQVADLSVNRGFLANAEKVRVRGVEIDASYRYKKVIALNGALSFTDGTYVSFPNAPPPLEGTGGETFKDISGGQLPGISRWAATVGAESSVKGTLLGQTGDYFVGVDAFYRSSFSSSPSPSQYLNIDGYALLNGRLGYRATEGVTLFVWSRNLLNVNYFEQLFPGAGNAGHYAGVLGDQRTFGITIRYNIQ